jgi:chitodextrinase
LSPFYHQAIGKFPAVCGYVGKEDKSDAICRKTLATMFAHFAQETGNHNPSDKEYEEWRQGLSSVREQGCTDTSPGCGYNSNC